jgi:hypothetical protein
MAVAFSSGMSTQLLPYIQIFEVTRAAVLHLAVACPSSAQPSRSSILAVRLRPNSLEPTTLCQLFAGRDIFFSNRDTVLRQTSCIRTTKVRSSWRRTERLRAASVRSTSIFAFSLLPTESPRASCRYFGAQHWISTLDINIGYDRGFCN